MRAELLRLIEEDMAKILDHCSKTGISNETLLLFCFDMSCISFVIEGLEDLLHRLVSKFHPIKNPVISSSQPMQLYCLKTVKILVSRLEEAHRSGGHTLALDIIMSSFQTPNKSTKEFAALWLQDIFSSGIQVESDAIGHLLDSLLLLGIRGIQLS